MPVSSLKSDLAYIFYELNKTYVSACYPCALNNPTIQYSNGIVDHINYLTFTLNWNGFDRQQCSDSGTKLGQLHKNRNSMARQNISKPAKGIHVFVLNNHSASRAS